MQLHIGTWRADYYTTVPIFGQPLRLNSVGCCSNIISLKILEKFQFNFRNQFTEIFSGTNSVFWLCNFPGNDWIPGAPSFLVCGPSSLCCSPQPETPRLSGVASTECWLSLWWSLWFPALPLGPVDPALLCYPAKCKRATLENVNGLPWKL